MARKKLLDTIDEVAKGAEIKANTIETLNISDDKLLDYPDNNEDVSYTEDLEVSMEENGFTDPIEVTDFGMKPGFYMIISGHRRRVAGRKKGYKTFPCIVRHFKTKKELKNFVLMSNAYRNTENDPLLYSTRYKMHEQYLKESEFKGSFMNEIAKRLGMTVKSLEKYKQMNKVIMPVWDMVRSGTVGMSSVLFMATYSVDEQEEIYNIFQDNLANGIALTRDRCKEIKREYELKDTVAEEEEQITIETLEDGKYMPEPVELPAEKPVSEPINDMPEMPPVKELIKDCVGGIPAPIPKPEPAPVEEPVKPVKEKVKNDFKELSDVNGSKLMHYLHMVDSTLDEYTLKNSNEAAAMSNKINGVIIDLLCELEKIGVNHGMTGHCMALVRDSAKMANTIYERN